jgi:hypothetical protein
VDADDEGALCRTLFRGLVFLLGREVPKEALLLVIRAFGGTVGWQGEGSPLQESDEAITHQVGCAALGGELCPFRLYSDVMRNLPLNVLRPPMLGPSC